MSSSLSPAQAEHLLLDRELFGMRFGLDRMQRLMTVLGSPQRRFDSIHVVGTNGKSSTVRMIAAILEAHRIATGVFLSPHLESFAERIRVGDRDLTPDGLAVAVGRAAAAAEKVDRTLTPPDRVTQFELLTAAAYAELAARGVEVAVIEAGLGGRYDATNVIPSHVQVLTNVGLEHTRWLGPTVADIAGEKLAVVRDGSTLVVGANLHPDAMALAREAAAEHGARLVQAPADTGVPLAALGSFQRGNFALACGAAEAHLGELDPQAVRAAGQSVLVPGRCQAIDADPLTIADGAHNAEGARALAGALPELADGRDVVGVLSILDDKDAAGMLTELLPRLSAVVFTTNRNPRALPPATLQSLSEQVAAEPPPSELESDPRAAVGRARELAGREGVVLVTGSIYLVADLMSAPSAGRASIL